MPGSPLGPEVTKNSTTAQHSPTEQGCTFPCDHSPPWGPPRSSTATYLAVQGALPVHLCQAHRGSQDRLGILCHQWVQFVLHNTGRAESGHPTLRLMATQGSEALSQRSQPCPPCHHAPFSPWSPFCPFIVPMSTGSMDPGLPGSPTSPFSPLKPGSPLGPEEPGKPCSPVERREGPVSPGATIAAGLLGANNEGENPAEVPKVTSGDKHLVTWEKPAPGDWMRTQGRGFLKCFLR